MLPRKVVEELIGWSGSAGLHVLAALPDALDSLLIILALPFEVVGKDVVKSVGGALATTAGKILELRQPFRLHRQRFHGFKQYPTSQRTASLLNRVVDASTKDGRASEGIEDIHTHPALPRSARVALHVTF
jgi:hypothetical protein